MSDSQPTPASRAVFVSYAREDTASAQRIAEALRSQGVEVWFDQAELRGGDAWDQKIRKQINDCTLFLPIISKNTQVRGKGYFRLEWKLAVEQTHLMAEGIAFLAPVVIDDTAESAAVVPPEFLKVQWTRLSGGLPTTQFIGQIKHLLSASVPADLTTPPMPMRPAAVAPIAASAATAPKASFPTAIIAALGVAVLALVAYVALRPGAKETPPFTAPAKPAAEIKVAAAIPAAAPTLPPLAPEKSIAVLPFENLSPDKDEAFFAEGMHDDVIISLTKIRDLKVIGRTSVLPYRDTATRNHKQIAADLGVATLLEGSVRRAGTKVRVTAQLINARTDESLWAETYDVDLTDAFTIQSALAQNITAALKANFAPGERAYVAERPTQNQEAYDLYLRGKTTFENGVVTSASGREIMDQAIDFYEKAVAKDPSFAAAYAQLAYLNGRMFWYPNLDPSPARRDRAKAALDLSLRLAPDKPDTHRAQGVYAYYCEHDWSHALAEFRLAASALPNDAQLLYFMGLSLRRLGDHLEAANYFARSMELNPRENVRANMQLQTLGMLRRWTELRHLATRYEAMFPGDSEMMQYDLHARLEIDHDREAFLRDWPNLPPRAGDRFKLIRAYRIALMRGDFSAAEAVLSDPRLKSIAGQGGRIDEPLDLHRALVAFLSGRLKDATVFAERTLEYYEHGKWETIQLTDVMFGRALAHAAAGHVEEAIRLGREAYARLMAEDRYLANNARSLLAEVYLVCDHRDDAFSILREIVTAPDGSGIEVLRMDPYWARVKDDARFEEILKLAKPL